MRGEEKSYSGGGIPVVLGIGAFGGFPFYTSESRPEERRWDGKKESASLAVGIFMARKQGTRLARVSSYLFVALFVLSCIHLSR